MTRANNNIRTNQEIPNNVKELNIKTNMVVKTQYIILNRFVSTLISVINNIRLELKTRNTANNIQSIPINRYATRLKKPQRFIIFV